jgi:hypothetical protein
MYLSFPDLLARRLSGGIGESSLFNSSELSRPERVAEETGQVRCRTFNATAEPMKLHRYRTPCGIIRSRSIYGGRSWQSACRCPSRW